MVGLVILFSSICWALLLLLVSSPALAAVSILPTSSLPTTTPATGRSSQQLPSRNVKYASQLQMPAVPSPQHPSSQSSATVVGSVSGTKTAVPSSSSQNSVFNVPKSNLCFEDELEYVERCYRFISYNVTWHEAESICLTRHGHLASVPSLLKNNWIVQHMAAESWIGLQRLGTKNNSQLGFLPAYEEPQRTFLPNKLNYVWQDDYCNSKHHAVCERDPLLPRGGRTELNYQRTNKLGQLVIQMRHTIDDLKREAAYRENAMHEKFSLEAIWIWLKALAVLTVLVVSLLTLTVVWLVIQLRNKRIITLPSALHTFGANHVADFAARRRINNNTAGNNFHRLSESSSRITLEEGDVLASNGDVVGEEATGVMSPPSEPPPPLPWSPRTPARNGPAVTLASASPHPHVGAAGHTNSSNATTQY